jgi:MoaA/NifB/PqqE/SkfB family radical SAM enzyme
VVTSTNAHFLQDGTYLDAVLTSGLSTLIVALDSLHADSYATYRRQGSVNRAMDGLRRVVAAKRRLGSPTRVNVRAVAMRQNEGELDSLRALAREMGADWFTVKTLNPSCGGKAMDEELVPTDPRLRRYAYDQATGARIRVNPRCWRVWQMSNIFCGGEVVPCCYDYRASMRVGNVREEALSRLWNGPAYRALRRRIWEEAASLPTCSDCGVNFKLAHKGWFVESADLTCGSLSARLRRRRLRLRDLWNRRILNGLRRRLRR